MKRKERTETADLLRPPPAPAAAAAAAGAAAAAHHHHLQHGRNESVV
jgi:hypothetical protein